MSSPGASDERAHRGDTRGIPRTGSSRARRDSPGDSRDRRSRGDRGPARRALERAALPSSPRLLSARSASRRRSRRSRRCWASVPAQRSPCADRAAPPALRARSRSREQTRRSCRGAFAGASRSRPARAPGSSLAVALGGAIVAHSSVTCCRWLARDAPRSRRGRGSASPLRLAQSSLLLAVALAAAANLPPLHAGAVLAACLSVTSLSATPLARFLSAGDLPASSTRILAALALFGAGVSALAAERLLPLGKRAPSPARSA